jgi:hypothetical protein
MASLMAGTAMAAEPLTDQTMDMVTAGGIPIIAVPGTPINNPGFPGVPGTPIHNPGFGGVPGTPIHNPGFPGVPGTPIPVPPA